MGHEYDGIVEAATHYQMVDIPFSSVRLFAAVYLALYPGLQSNFKGLLGWTSSNQTVHGALKSLALQI